MYRFSRGAVRTQRARRVPPVRQRPSAPARHARPKADAGAPGVEPRADNGLGDDVRDHVLGGNLPQGDRATCRPPADHGVLGRQPANGHRVLEGDRRRVQFGSRGAIEPIGAPPSPRVMMIRPA